MPRSPHPVSEVRFQAARYRRSTKFARWSLLANPARPAKSAWYRPVPALSKRYILGNRKITDFFAIFGHHPVPLMNDQMTTDDATDRAFSIYPEIRKMFDEFKAKIAFVLIFIGFNVTFFPQFIMGSLGMPRRYFNYDPEFALFHQLSTYGSWITAIGFILMVYNFFKFQCKCCFLLIDPNLAPV